MSIRQWAAPRAGRQRLTHAGTLPAPPTAASPERPPLRAHTSRRPLPGSLPTSMAMSFSFSMTRGRFYASLMALLAEATKASFSDFRASFDTSSWKAKRSPSLSTSFCLGTLIWQT